MSSYNGEAVYRRILERCVHEMEHTRCPEEVFLSSKDWRDLGDYLSSKAVYITEPLPLDLAGMRVHIDGNNQPVEVRDIGRITLV